MARAGRVALVATPGIRFIERRAPAGSQATGRLKRSRLEASGVVLAPGSSGRL